MLGLLLSRRVIESLARKGLVALSTWLIAQGYAEADSLTTLAEVAPGIAGILWGILDKRGLV